MRILRLAPVALLGLAAVLAQPAAVLADASTHQRVVTPFTFTLTPAECPLVTVPVTGSGNYIDEISTQTAADGSIHFVDNSLAIGDATDALGNTYHFNYHNHIGRDIAPDGSREVLVNDHFNLEGSGPDSGVHAGFIQQVTISPTGDRTVVIINTRGGGPSCDPI